MMQDFTLVVVVSVPLYADEGNYLKGKDTALAIALLELGATTYCILLLGKHPNCCRTAVVCRLLQCSNKMTIKNW
jgi:hypothetical protein